ncbi:MAG: Sec-independent protein translocase protein TatB [Steroidobacteraceae bacterium]|jgi:sec-independent protein translocase protein TatB|nr:Sec-independent protein translocase protein TatB [Steroidobacteraceae bacterium]
MFEVGFSELLLIMALALVVLGPEKLPKVASQVGRWMGRARAMARQFRETLEEEVQLEETQRRTAPKNTSGGGGTASSTPAADPYATAPAAAAGLAASAVDNPADALSPMDPAYTGGYATTSDPDTRHNDYAGAAYEPPAAPPDTSVDPLASTYAEPPASSPAGTAPDDTRGAEAPADAHGQRGS